jgi:hypothetical protein
MGFFDALFGSSRATRSTAKKEAASAKRELARIKKELADFKPGKIHPNVRKRLNFKPEMGKIYLPTQSARDLWVAEFLGQLSDGIWENVESVLSDVSLSEEEWDLINSHWVYWRFLQPVIGSPPRVVSKHGPYIRKSEYRLAREKKWLLGNNNPLEERMLLTGSISDPDYNRKKLHADIRAIFTAMNSAWK